MSYWNEYNLRTFPLKPSILFMAAGETNFYKQEGKKGDLAQI